MPLLLKAVIATGDSLTKEKSISEDNQMHKFGGRWTSTVFNHPTGEVPQKRGDGHFDLDMDEDGSFRRNRHVRSSGTEHAIEVVEHETGLILIERDPYRIFSAVEFINLGIFRMILGDAVKPEEDSKRGGAKEPFAQEEGTWVGTQP
jgi:hypothetical protein